jgi:hypothetical protein
MNTNLDLDQENRNIELFVGDNKFSILLLILLWNSFEAYTSP